MLRKVEEHLAEQTHMIIILSQSTHTYTQIKWNCVLLTFKPVASIYNVHYQQSEKNHKHEKNLNM